MPAAGPDRPLTRPEAPWERPDLFPERPAASPYGYVKGGSAIACTREELPRRASGLVWTPDHASMVLDTEVPELAGVVRSRLRASLRQSVLWMIYGALLAWFLAMLSGSLGLTVLPLVFFVLPALASVVDVVSERRALGRRERRLEPWSPDVAGRFQFWIGTRSAVFTWTVAAGIALCGVCQLVAGVETSIAAAGVVKDGIRAGEWWRLLTGTLLHGGMLHFIFNAGALLSLGAAAEALAGGARLALVLLASLLAGSVASLALLPDVDSVGASGGLLGLLGFLIVLGRRQRMALPAGFVRSLVKSVLWVAAAGAFAYAFIDNAAHAGGFLMGTAAGLALAPADAALPLAESRLLRVSGRLALAALAALSLATAGVVLAHRAP